MLHFVRTGGPSPGFLLQPIDQRRPFDYKIEDPGQRHRKQEKQSKKNYHPNSFMGVEGSHIQKPSEKGTDAIPESHDRCPPSAYFFHHSFGLGWSFSFSAAKS